MNLNAPGNFNPSALDSLRFPDTDPRPRFRLQRTPTSSLALSAAQIEALILDLGSDRFATRERASETLFAVGPAALPALRKWIHRASDLEMQLRIRALLEQLGKGDLQTRVESFLAGNDAGMKNWPILRYLFSDSIRVRELYVELLKTYPELIEKLDGSPRELSAITRSISQSLSERHIGLRTLPNRVDVIAALLPATDPKVQLDQEFEARLLAMLTVHTTNELRRDPAFGKSLDGLVSLWVERSGEFQRVEVLRLAMRWNLKTALPLAKTTLESAQHRAIDPELLATCFQAISKYGTLRDAQLLRAFLDDQREVAKPLFDIDAIPVSVADTAMAAVAVLHQIPLTELGFLHPAEHPTFGFLFDQLVHQTPQPESKQTAKSKILKLLDNPKHPRS